MSPLSLPYRCRGALLSRGEIAFFRVLLRAVSGLYVVALKVRVADVLSCSQSDWDAGFGHLIARHHLDFVLCNRKSMRIVAAVELDDRSHMLASRRRRDEFIDRAFAAAGVPLVRIAAKRDYCPSELSVAVERTLSGRKYRKRVTSRT